MTWLVMSSRLLFVCCYRLGCGYSIYVYNLFRMCFVVIVSELCLQRAALAGPPDILISTPACVAKCLSGGILKAASISESLETLVLDEVKPDAVNCLFRIFVCWLLSISETTSIFFFKVELYSQSICNVCCFHALLNGLSYQYNSSS